MSFSIGSGIRNEVRQSNLNIDYHMTKDYTLNNCALSYNMSTAYNFQGFRKGMYVELLVMFLIYFAGQIYQAIKSSQSTHSH